MVSPASSGRYCCGEHAVRAVVRVPVADPVAQRLLARCGGGAEVVGHLGRRGVRHRLPGGSHRQGDAVRLGSQRQVDGGMGEGVGRLGEADDAEGVEGGDGEPQRPVVRQPDVLGGEDDHAPGDELRVLPRLEHGVEPVEGGVGVRPAQRLDEGRDDVVVAVARLVVADDPPLQRLLDLGLGDRRATPGGDPRRHLERVERQPGVAADPFGEQGDDVVIDRWRASQAPHRVVGGPAHQGGHRLGRQRVGAEQRAAADQRRVDLEEGVLGGGADECDDPVLDPGQQGVLLGLVEPVDLVDEEHGAAAPLLQSPPRLVEHGPDVLDPRRGRRERLEAGRRRRGDQPRQRGLPGPRRSPQDHRHRAGLHDRPERRPRVGQVSLARPPRRAWPGACAPPAVPPPTWLRRGRRRRGRAPGSPAHGTARP